MKETLLKGLSSGAVAGIATIAVFGEAGTIDVMNMAINPAIVAGIAVGAGSVASDYLSENVIENMNLPQNIVTTEEMAIRVGICGAASAVALSFAGVPSANLLKAALLGGASKLGGDYVFEKVLSPKTGMLPLF